MNSAKSQILSFWKCNPLKSCLKYFEMVMGNGGDTIGTLGGLIPSDVALSCMLDAIVTSGQAGCLLNTASLRSI